MHFSLLLAACFWGSPKASLTVTIKPVCRVFAFSAFWCPHFPRFRSVASPQTLVSWVKRDLPAFSKFPRHRVRIADFESPTNRLYSDRPQETWNICVLLQRGASQKGANRQPSFADQSSFDTSLGRRQNKHIHFLNINFPSPPKMTHFGPASRSKFMCLTSWERMRKEDPHKLFSEGFWGQKGGPK